MYICSDNKTERSYIPALERWSLYKSIWINHWQSYLRTCKNRPSSGKVFEVKKLLKCGNFQNGFQRYTCKDCKTILVVPFSCKSRLCLSCYRKKLFSWSVNLSMILDTDFQHDHVTFTVPGKVSLMFLERNYSPERMISLASKVYRDELCKANKVPVRERKVCKPGILATLHKCGNSLNYNPHVHLVGTRELVNTETGEILKTNFISYKSFRFAWMNAVCKHLVREKILTKDDVQQIKQRYKNGFHVYFQPIKGDSNEVLFRTSEYIATGFFHNSQIIKVDHDSKKVTFRYKSWVDRNTGKKSYRVITMDIYQFIDKMLYFLPEPGRKMIRYYGIYAQSIRGSTGSPTDLMDSSNRAQLPCKTSKLPRLWRRDGAFCRVFRNCISRNKQATPNSRPAEGIFSTGETTIANLTFYPNLTYKRLTEFLKILFSEARFLMSTGQIFSEF
jgi:hypothetical protein